MEDKLVVDLLHYPDPTIVPGPGSPNTRPMSASIKFNRDGFKNCTSVKIVGYAIQSAYGNEQGALNIPPRDPYVLVDINVNARNQTSVAGYNRFYYTGLEVGPTANPYAPMTGAPIPRETGTQFEVVNGIPLLMPALDSISVPSLFPPIDITNLCSNGNQMFDLQSMDIEVRRPPVQLRNINKSGAINTVQTDAVLMDRLTLILSITRVNNVQHGTSMKDIALPNPARLNDTDGNSFTDNMRAANFHQFGQPPWL